MAEFREIDANEVYLSPLDERGMPTGERIPIAGPGIIRVNAVVDATDEFNDTITGLGQVALRVNLQLSEFGREWVACIIADMKQRERQRKRAYYAARKSRKAWRKGKR